jgi:uncharacterized protein (TIGR03435 family)
LCVKSEPVSLRPIVAVLMVFGYATAVKGVAQAGEPASPAFEVVSIRPSGPQSPRGSRGGPGSSGPERYEFYSATVLDLISVAWNVDSFQISSKADLDRDHFDVDAKVPAGATKGEFRLMLQNMLAERFGLRAHVEERDFPAYALRVAKSGLKIKEADDHVGEERKQGGGGQTASTQEVPSFRSKQSISGSGLVVSIEARLEPMSVLVRSMPKPDGLPVVDETGLSGRFSYTLDYSEDPSGPPELSAQDAPSLATALRRLGLELVRTNAPFKVVTVESIDRAPTPN